jgi:Cu/Ag efflux pump CusA
MLFLHSIRNSLIVMVSIPASLIATFIGIYLLIYLKLNEFIRSISCGRFLSMMQL